MIILQVTVEELAGLIRDAVKAEMAAAKPIQQTKSQQTYMSRKEAAAALRVSLPTLNTWTFQGKVKASRIGRKILYKPEDIDAAMQEVKIK